jgi:predicted ATPase
VAAVARQPEEEVRDALNRLTDAGLIFQRGNLPDATFLFKHDLVQNAAYGTPLRGTRRALHADIGRALEARFPDLAGAQPQILAYHFTEAGLPESAVDYWHRAGQRALRRSEFVEATRHLRRGIELIPLLPAGSERDLREFRLF